MRHWHHGPHGGMPWLLPGITFLLLLLLLGVLLAVLWRTSTHRTTGPAAGPHRGTPPPPRLPEAERVLADRLARGEIDVDEYRHRLAALRDTPPGDAPPGDPGKP